MLPFSRISVIGLGLIGSSLLLAIRDAMPTVALTGHDASPDVRATARRLNLADDITDTAGAAVTDADLVILCVPVRAMADVAEAIRDDLPPEAIISDVGSCKGEILASLTTALPHHAVIPAHPVAGTENSVIVFQSADASILYIGLAAHCVAGEGGRVTIQETNGRTAGGTVTPCCRPSRTLERMAGIPSR